MDPFVSAYAKSTGLKQRIPRHWLGHPVLGRDFELTPSAKAASAGDHSPPERQFFLARGGDVFAADDMAAGPVAAPDESWTRALLDAYARDVWGLRPSDMRTKADVVTAIATAAAEHTALMNDPNTPDPDDTPSSDETPATGDNEEE